MKLWLYWVVNRIVYKQLLFFTFLCYYFHCYLIHPNSGSDIFKEVINMKAMVMIDLDLRRYFS